MKVSYQYNYLKLFFTNGNQRTLRAKKNITVSFVSKGISLIISFLIVPLTLSYIGKVEYGIWMTISSIISWFAFFDIGLGNGLRNKLAESLAKEDKGTAVIYISSTFALITVIAAIMFLTFTIAGFFISWNTVLNTDLIDNAELFKIVVVVFFFFCLGFIFNILSSILQAMQLYAINDILGVIAQLLGLVAIFVLVNTTDGSLFYLCLVYGSKTSIIMLLASILLFTGKLKDLRPQFSQIKLKKAMPLINLGVWFFVNQILYLISTQSSIILVVQFFGPEDVTVYNLAHRYMTLISMLYLMVLTPFLSAFTEAFTKNDFNWIKKTIFQINKIWGVALLGTILLTFGYKIFFRIWVGDQIIIPNNLILSLGLLSVINTLSSTYTLFLNGIGKIRLQFYAGLIAAILFIPLSYTLYVLDFGLVSLVIPQIIFALFSSVVFISQYKRLVNQRANGIWIK